MAHDLHIHMVLDGLDWRAAIARHAQGPDIPYIRQVLGRYQAAGYTYLRDGGDRWGVGAAARELAPAFGITYRTPLAPLCWAGHYGSFIGETFDSIPQYTALVRGHKAAGADFIKIMISGLMDFDRFGRLTEEGLTKEQIRQLIRIAHQEGMAVMAHANGARTVEAAAEAGVDSVEHGAYLDQAALEAMAQAGVVWVPTLSTLVGPMGKGRFPDPVLERICASAARNVVRYAQLGGLIGCGTDAGAWAVPHATDLERHLLAKILEDRTEPVLSAAAEKIREKF